MYNPNIYLCEKMKCHVTHSFQLKIALFLNIFIEREKMFAKNISTVKTSSSCSIVFALQNSINELEWIGFENIDIWSLGVHLCFCLWEKEQLLQSVNSSGFLILPSNQIITISI